MPLSLGLLNLKPLITDLVEQRADMPTDKDPNDLQIDLVDEGLDLAIQIGRLQDLNLIARPTW